MEELSKRERRQLRMDAFISRHPFLEFLYCRVLFGYFNGDPILVLITLAIMVVLTALIAILCLI